MPTLGHPKPEGDEPDPSPESEKVPSSQQSVEGERKSKEGSVPESLRTSPDETPAGGSADAAKKGGVPPGYFRICGLNVIPSHHYYCTSSSDDESDYYDDSEDDDYEYDEEWIACYSEESNPHFTAVRAACELVLNNARAVVANYEFLKRKGYEGDYDTSRLSRLCSHLALLNDDLEDLKLATTPDSVLSSGYEVDSLLCLIRCLSRTGPRRVTKEAVEGKVNGELIMSTYRGYKNFRSQSLQQWRISQWKILQCFEMANKYECAFLGYYKETKVLEETKYVWPKVKMAESDLKVWNEEMRAILKVAKKLFSYVEAIESMLLDNLASYLEYRKDLRKQLSQFLCLGVPTVLSEEITAV